MFVGEEGVGKTSLLTCFKNSTHKLKKGTRNLSTNGIAMSEWKANKGMKIQCYDMGGQMVFYPTHEFFMSGRSIYLVVFSILISYAYNAYLTRHGKADLRISRRLLDKEDQVNDSS
jgi:GTPase SAR1 family protein